MLNTANVAVLAPDTNAPRRCSVISAASHTDTTERLLQHTLDLSFYDYKHNDHHRKHLREKGERVRINVSGKKFETYERTLTSKEGSIFKLSSVTKYYDEENEEFYFERDGRAFEAILVYLQCGILEKPDNVAYKVFIEELQFFGFGDIAFKIFNEGSGRRIAQNKSSGQEHISPIRRNLWNVLENPDFNLLAWSLAIISTLIIFLSVTIFCIDTLPNISKSGTKVFYNVETFCVSYFTVELIVRYVISPQKCKFFMYPINIVDIVSILPFYIDLAISEEGNSLIAFAVLRALRIIRVFRIFKLYRYSKAIHLIIYTVRSSCRELILLVFFILVLMVLFAAGIYYFENNPMDDANKFQSIPHTFWLCIVTITTVGYGDMVPSTPGGRFITSILSVIGVLVVALPIPIIVNNFSKYYEKIMSTSPAYRFDFDEEKSHQVENEMFCSPPLEQRVTTL